MENSSNPNYITSKENLVETCLKQIEAGEKAKSSRFEAIRKNEDEYNNVPRPVLKGRFNIPFPFMGGFVDTLMSKIDDAPNLKFEKNCLADLKKSKLVTGAYQISKKTGRWNLRDRFSKKLACFSGRAILLKYASSDPDFKDYLLNIDHNDFGCEPNGGGWLEDHLFCYRRNVFLTKEDIETGAKLGYYNQEKVTKLLTELNTEEYKKAIDDFKKKNNRHSSLGLNAEDNNYIGQAIINFTQHCADFGGVRYFFLINEPTKIAIRISTMEYIFGFNQYPFVSWATHEDPFVFWTKAPCDDMRPIGIAMKDALNQALENREKRTWNQRAYDIDIFPNPEELNYRSDGLVGVKIPTGSNKNIQNGIYNFVTPEVSGTVDLVSYLDRLVGTKTGVTSDAQGASDETKVGIYMGNMQQVADRMGLLNKSYSECWEEIGERYWKGLIEHCPEKMMVKLVGTEKGVEWDEIKGKEDINPSADFSVVVSGGNAEAKMNEFKITKKSEALKGVLNNPVLASKLNPNWLIEKILANGEFSEDEIASALDKSNGYNQEIIAEAASENERIVSGEEVKPNHGATTAHCQKHLDFAYDTELSDEIRKKIINHFDSEVPLAAENMKRKMDLEKIFLNNSLENSGAPGQGDVRPEVPGNRGNVPAVVAPGPAIV